MYDKLFSKVKNSSTRAKVLHGFPRSKSMHSSPNFFFLFSPTSNEFMNQFLIQKIHYIPLLENIKSNGTSSRVFSLIRHLFVINSILRSVYSLNFKKTLAKQVTHAHIVRKSVWPVNWKTPRKNVRTCPNPACNWGWKPVLDIKNIKTARKFNSYLLQELELKVTIDKQRRFRRYVLLKRNMLLDTRSLCVLNNSNLECVLQYKWD